MVQKLPPRSCTLYRWVSRILIPHPLWNTSKVMFVLSKETAWMKTSLILNYALKTTTITTTLITLHSLKMILLCLFWSTVLQAPRTAILVTNRFTPSPLCEHSCQVINQDGWPHGFCTRQLSPLAFSTSYKLSHFQVYMNSDPKEGSNKVNHSRCFCNID